MTRDCTSIKLKPSIMIASFMPGTALGDRSVYPAEFIENI